MMDSAGTSKHRFAGQSTAALKAKLARGPNVTENAADHNRFAEEVSRREGDDRRRAMLAKEMQANHAAAEANFLKALDARKRAAAAAQPAAQQAGTPPTQANAYGPPVAPGQAPG